MAFKYNNAIKSPNSQNAEHAIITDSEPETAKMDGKNVILTINIATNRRVIIKTKKMYFAKENLG